MKRYAPLIACGAALMAACAAAPSDVPSHSGITVRSHLPGTWDWETSQPPCGKSAGTFSFSADGRQVQVGIPAAAAPGAAPAERNVLYDVLADKGKTMRLRAVGETRMTDTGVPVEWDLILFDADTFCWHRTDWTAGRCTPLLKRCAAH